MYSKLITATAFSLMIAAGGAMAQSSTGSGGTSGAGDQGTIGGANGTVTPGAGNNNGAAQPIDPNTTNSTTNGVTQQPMSRDCNDMANSKANAAPGADANSAIDNKCK